MVCLQLGMDPVRFTQVYIVQSCLGILFLVLAYLILKRDRKRLNLIFSLYYIVAASGVFVNWIYAPLTDEGIVLILYFITTSLMLSGGIFLVVFDLMIYKSEKIFTKSKQYTVIFAYIGVVIGLIFLYYAPEPAVLINSTTDWKPVYSLTFFITLLILISLGVCLPTMFYSVKIYQKFEDEALQKKWRLFLIGDILVFLAIYSTVTSNFLNNQTYRTINAVIALICTVLGPILMYYGVGKQIDK